MLRTQLKTISVSPLEEFRFGPANQEARSRGDNERRACPRGTNQLRAGELPVPTGGYNSHRPTRLGENMRACCRAVCTPKHIWSLALVVCRSAVFKLIVRFLYLISLDIIHRPIF
jgi:hypothetical protein